MDKFLFTCNLPKLNQEDINNLNRFIMINNIGAMIVSKEKLRTQFIAELYQTFKETLTPVFLNYSIKQKLILQSLDYPNTKTK
jgi:hypothetical protein